MKSVLDHSHDFESLRCSTRELERRLERALRAIEDLMEADVMGLADSPEYVRAQSVVLQERSR